MSNFFQKIPDGLELAYRDIRHSKQTCFYIRHKKLNICVAKTIDGRVWEADGGDAIEDLLEDMSNILNILTACRLV